MSLHVESASGLVTVQDRGRFGLAHLGVPRAGALDRPAADLANRLVANPPGAAVIEATWGSLTVRTDEGVWCAVTGARGEVRIDGAARSHGRAEWLAAGARLEITPPAHGMRTYLAVAGGIEVQPVLGSRSTDTLAWVGPPQVGEGQVLPVGDGRGEPAEHETPRPPQPGPLRLTRGPRSDWFDDGAWETLTTTPYVVGSRSNRIGLRLEGARLARRSEAELPSEGVVLGGVQVPADGQPVVFLADHPVTGGYPVIGVVDERDLWQCAQARPGERLRFTPDRTGS